MDTGFILVDKPMDWTSHDVVGYLRGVTHIKKIGHTGTLDPFATGLLIVAVGRAATKRIDEFHRFKKTYEAKITLGAVSNTQDRTGTIQDQESRVKNQEITEEKVREVLDSFVGEQEQIPPMFSAKKIKGKKLYELARKGEEVERKPNIITVHSIELLSLSEDTLSIRCVVSTGTYVRTLAHDIGQALGTGAYCEELRRTNIGPYTVRNAITPKELERDSWQQRLITCAA